MPNKDLGKLIAFMANQSLPVWEFEDIGELWKKADANAIYPIIAVPTTAGTGSEVGRASVLTDTKRNIKKVIFHPKILPQQVICDPLLTLEMPKNITAKAIPWISALTSASIDTIQMKRVLKFAEITYHKRFIAEKEDRIKLIKEEFEEFVEACRTKDFGEARDAIADMLYVVYGAADAFGIKADQVRMIGRETVGWGVGSGVVTGTSQVQIIVSVVVVALKTQQKI